MNKPHQVSLQLVNTVGSIFIIALILLGLWLLYQELNEYKHPEILIKWKTGSELDIVGYNILKSNSRSNNYSRINSSIIPAALDPLAGNEYQYLDHEVKPNTRYYYQLEAISQDGSIMLYGTIESSVQKTTILGLALAIISLLSGFIILFVLLKSSRAKNDHKDILS